MSSELALRLLGLFCTSIVALAAVMSFPSRTVDLSGWQAVSVIALGAAIFSQALSLGAGK